MPFYFGPRFSHPNGEGGEHFDAGKNISGVKTIIIRTGKYVDGIKFEFKDGSSTNHYGGQGGKEQTYQVAPNDNIIKVNVWQCWGTDAIQFITQIGQTSPKYGGNGGNLVTHEAPPEMVLVGFTGRHGSLIDKFIPVWGEVDKVTSVRLDLQLIAHCHGGSKGSHKLNCTTTKGYKGSFQSSSNVTTIATEAKYNLAQTFLSGSAEFNRKYESYFHDATEQTFKEQKHEITIDIDFEKPCYIYTARVTAVTKAGFQHTFSNDALIQSPEPLLKVSSSVTNA